VASRHSAPPAAGFHDVARDGADHYRHRRLERSPLLRVAEWRGAGGFVGSGQCVVGTRRQATSYSGGQVACGPALHKVLSVAGSTLICFTGYTYISDNDAPVPQAVRAVGRILPTPILGGLHQQYARICVARTPRDTNLNRASAVVRRLLVWCFRNRETGAITVAQTPNLALSVILVSTAILWLRHPKVPYRQWPRWSPPAV
jgi:hypothetical protein